MDAYKCNVECVTSGFECIDKIPGDRVDVNGEVGDELLYELELIRVQY